MGTPSKIHIATEIITSAVQETGRIEHLVYSRCSMSSCAPRSPTGCAGRGAIGHDVFVLQNLGEPGATCIP